MKKYVQALREITGKNHLEEFLSWYLDFPSQQHNLFAIAAQK